MNLVVHIIVPRVSTKTASEVEHVADLPLEPTVCTMERLTLRKQNSGSWNMIPVATCTLKRTVSDSADVNWVGVSFIVNTMGGFRKLGKLFKNLVMTTAGTNLTKNVSKAADATESPPETCEYNGRRHPKEEKLWYMEHDPSCYMYFEENCNRFSRCELGGGVYYCKYEGRYRKVGDWFDDPDNGYGHRKYHKFDSQCGMHQR